MADPKRPDEAYIPPNFRRGISVFGFMVKTSNAVQAVPFVMASVILIFTLGASLSVTAKLALLAITCAPSVLVCAAGINGGSVFAFFACLAAEKRARGEYYYNPALRPEVEKDVPSREQLLPRDRILLMIERMKKDEDGRGKESGVPSGELYFTDDAETAGRKKHERRKRT